MSILGKLQNIDRRIAYLLLVVVVAIPLRWNVFRMPMAMTDQDEVAKAYQAVQSVPEGKIAIISIVWAAGTIAENRPQTEVIARHLFQKGIPFAILPWDQQGTTLAYNAVDRVAREMGKEYGKDWISFGFKPAYIAMILQSMARSIPKTFQRDIHGTPLSKIPMMQGIENVRDLGLVTEVTPSATVGEWIAFIGQPYRVPIIYSPTAVMAPEGYAYLDAGQIVGMLPGLIGATKYENLLHHPGFATRAANALSTSHLLIIILIILGNVGLYADRRRRDAR